MMLMIEALRKGDQADALPVGGDADLRALVRGLSAEPVGHGARNLPFVAVCGTEAEVDRDKVLRRDAADEAYALLSRARQAAN
ncbi:MAG TPA: hypothetical protein VF396_03060 [Bradyrhizobium sp.]